MSTFSVCPLCGHLSEFALPAWLDGCPSCGCKWPYHFDDLDDAIEFRTSVRDARRHFAQDDRDTIGEVCAAYNRLEARVERLEQNAVDTLRVFRAHAGHLA